MILGVKSFVRVDNYMIWWICSLPGNLTTTKPLIKWYGTFQYENPPLWTPGSAYYSKNESQSMCIYVMTWYISVAVRKTDAHSYTASASWSSPKWLASRLGPHNFRCPGAAPRKDIDLKFSQNVRRLVLGKVRKFQHRSSSGFWDILEKREGWMKTAPCH